MAVLLLNDAQIGIKSRDSIPLSEEWSIFLLNEATIRGSYLGTI